MLAWESSEREHVDVEWEAKEKSETNSGKKVQFGERQGKRLLNEIGERGNV